MPGIRSARLVWAACAALMALAMHIHGVREGYRILRPSVRRLSNLITLETCIGGGLTMIVASMLGFATVVSSWSNGGYVALPSVLPLVLSAITGAAGLQTLLGGFVLAIVSGNEAQFIKAPLEKIPAGGDSAQIDREAA